MPSLSVTGRAPLSLSSRPFYIFPLLVYLKTIRTVTALALTKAPKKSIKANPMGLVAFALYLCSFLHLLTAAAVYNATDYLLLDCGALSGDKSNDQRSWITDNGTKFLPPNANDLSSVDTTDEQGPSVERVPYLTARIFHSQFTYTFPVSSGPKFLRLHFFPATYSGLDKTQSFFSVDAGGHNLLGNFSAFLAIANSDDAFLVKEFVVYAGDNQKLEVTFSPSPNSYAFINGIEVVSMPDSLYLRGVGSNTTLVGQNTTFIVDKGTALETLRRLNVGGAALSVQNDTGMDRRWEDDTPYVRPPGVTPHIDFQVLYNNNTPAYTAPQIVYTTYRGMGPRGNPLQYNLTWTFAVYSGFSYLVRLHFCEFLKEVTGSNQRVFTVFLGNQTADKRVDVFSRAGGKYIPIFTDYVVSVPIGSNGVPAQQDLWLSLYPNIDMPHQFIDVLLSGVEIFKLNKSDGSLAGPNPEFSGVLSPPASDPQFPANPHKKGSSPIGGIVGGVVGGIVVISILALLIFKRRRRVKDSATSLAKTSWAPLSDTSKSSKTTASLLPSDLCRHFSLAEIKSATCNFDEGLVVGAGGFGSVYKGFLENGGITVAIKRLNPESNQGAREFQTEIEMLSKLRHLHLVSLIGYCDDDGEMILVYEYMSRGTLRDHLYKTKNPPLSWKQRLQICIGAARGLHYLHTGAKQGIIHRDVKSTNILLDEKWVAKVSDFGLSKLGPADVSQTHVSTAVKGSVGYVDPEYYRRQMLTEKSDVYSFGVVLLEVLCGRPALIAGLPKEQVSLAEWARQSYKKGTIDLMVDPLLDGQIAPESMRKFFEVAFSCLRDNGIERPGMNDVVWSLEFAIQLQEAAEKNMNDEDGFGPVKRVTARLMGEATMTDDDKDLFSVSRSTGTSTVESGEGTFSTDHFKSDTVFTEIMNPKGR